MLVLNPNCKLGGDREFLPIVDRVRESDVESPLSLPPSDESRNNQNWDSSSERDSGTGDSKKSSENVDVVDEVDTAPAETTTTTNPKEIRHQESMMSNQGGGESRISLSDFEATATTMIDNSTTEDIPYVDDEMGEDDEDDFYKMAADSGCGEALIASRPESLVSETLRRNLARSMTDDSSVTSRRSSNAKTSESSSRHLSLPGGGSNKAQPSKSLTPQPTNNSNNVVVPVPFRTFRPLQASQNNLSAAGNSDSVSAQQALTNGSARKRASTVELNGECYLAIEAADALAASAARLDPAVYRGGVGSAPPKQGLELQQRLLEESLNNTDYIISDDSRLSMRRHSRDRASMLNISSKGPLFRGPPSQNTKHQNSSSYYNSLPRRKSAKNAAKYKKLMAAQWSVDPDRTDVATKSTDMFT